MKNISFPDEPFPKSMANKSFPLGTVPFSSNSSSMSSSSSSSSIRSGGPSPFTRDKSVAPSLLPPSLSGFGKVKNKNLVPKPPSETSASPLTAPLSQKPQTAPPSAFMAVPSQKPSPNATQREERADRIFSNTERINNNVEFVINKLNELSQFVATLKIAEQNREIDVLKGEMDLLKKESKEYKDEIEKLKLKIKDLEKCDTDTDEEAKVEDEKEEEKEEHKVEQPVEEDVDDGL